MCSHTEQTKPHRISAPFGRTSTLHSLAKRPIYWCCLSLHVYRIAQRTVVVLTTTFGGVAVRSYKLAYLPPLGQRNFIEIYLLLPLTCVDITNSRQTSVTRWIDYCTRLWAECLSAQIKIINALAGLVENLKHHLDWVSERSQNLCWKILLGSFFRLTCISVLFSADLVLWLGQNHANRPQNRAGLARVSNSYHNI